MSRTWPQNPPGEAPLQGMLKERFLDQLGSDLVLVGGQALAYWMERYELLPQGELVSVDGDVLGKLGAAQRLAGQLRARLLEPPSQARTAIVAQLRIPVAGDELVNIDVLHQLYTMGGLKKSVVFTQRVIRNSLAIEWRPGVTIRVMDPFDLLESRVQNAAGLLEQKGPHVITQARWAIEVARIALLRLARHDGSPEGRLGAKMRAILTLARSQPGRILLKEHEMEILNAIDLVKLRWIAPAHQAQLDQIAAAIAKRARPA